MISNQDPVLLLLREACTRRVFPGVVICASRAGSLRYEHAVGSASLFPIPLPLVSTALFDVASLTKPVATTSAIMLLVDAGELELDLPIAEIFPMFGEHGKGAITVRHLLRHSSGLPAHLKFYEELNELRKQGEGPAWGPESVDWVLARIAALDCPAPDTKTEYSDLGFMILGRLIEKIAELPLERFCEEQIFLPLGMEDTFFLPLYQEDLRKSRLKERQIVVTEQCPWRGRLLSGEVHDDNCHSMGGVAGHAGLFSTAGDLHRFAYTMLQCERGISTFFSPAVVQEFWRLQDAVPGSTRTLGWDTPSPGGSQAGKMFSLQTVGHLGFTGCSLWIEREQSIVAVLLSNRVHPTRDNDAIKQFRPTLHDTLYQLLMPPAPLPPPHFAEGEPMMSVEPPFDGEERPVLNPPPQPEPFSRHLTPPVVEEDDQAPLPQDEFATTLDSAPRTPPPLAPRPFSADSDEDEFGE